MTRPREKIEKNPIAQSSSRLRGLRPGAPPTRFLFWVCLLPVKGEPGLKPRTTPASPGQALDCSSSDLIFFLGGRGSSRVRMGCWVPIRWVRGFLLSVSWLLVAARGSGLSVGRLVLLAHAGLGCAGRLGWTVRLRGEEIPGYRPGMAAPQPKITLVSRSKKSRKTLVSRGFCEVCMGPCRSLIGW